MFPRRAQTQVFQAFVMCLSSYVHGKLTIERAQTPLSSLHAPSNIAGQGIALCCIIVNSYKPYGLAANGKM